MPSPAAFIVAAPAALVVAALAAAASITGADAACRTGATACPIPVRMAPGTDTITLTGVVAPGQDCCAFAMRARAGQVLTWRIAGPAIRTTIRTPDGNADGPGLPASIPLPESGTYVFGVRPNLMAEGASGPFTVTFTIR
jgi:hypothetical protein